MSSIPIPRKDVSCQQLLSSSDVIHYGGLRQRQAVHRIVENALPPIVNIKWSRRYAVLHGGCLYLFTDEMSSHPLNCSTSLFGFTTCACCSQEVSPHIPWPFKLSSELETRQRIYYFSSASQNESLKWVEKIQQQMVIANSSLTITPKGATFGLFPPDAPSAEALPVPRERDRASSDPAGMSSVVHRKRLLPPTPNCVCDETAKHVLHETHADDDNYNYDDDGAYDELIDISKPTKAAGLIVGLRKLMSLNHSDSGKLQHSFSSPSAFSDHIEEPSDVDKSSSDNSDSCQGSPAAPSTCETMSPSPTTTMKPKPMTAVKPSVSMKKTVTRPLRPVEQSSIDHQPDTSPNSTQTSTPKPTPRKRTFSDSRTTCVEPALMAAYWSKSANEGEELMKSLTTVGTFMIRESQEPGQQTLMVRCEDSVRKYRIYSDEEGKFYLDATNPRFTTRSALVSHYMDHCLPQRTVMLTKAYSTVLLFTANAAATTPTVATYH